jgi:hypothetical protein
VKKGKENVQNENTFRRPRQSLELEIVILFVQFCCSGNVGLLPLYRLVQGNDSSMAKRAAIINFNV